ncbi:MAG: MFS transporter [Ilumatobacteraceae bacterium]
MTRDARLVLAAQAARAFGYGLGAVLLGATLDHRGYSSTEVGGVLAAVLAGTIVASLAVARWGDRFGRRRSYGVLYAVLAVTAVVFAFSKLLWPLVLISLAGGLSTEVVESGPFTSLEQAMLAGQIPRRELARGFGIYNAVATGAGSIGALAAAGIGPLRRSWSHAPTESRFFLLLVPAALAGLAIATRLTDSVEAPPVAEAMDSPSAHVLNKSRPVVVRLAGLFAIDSFGGGFVVQAFIAFWLAQRFHASLGVLGVTFFAVGILQTGSFLVAGSLAKRFGLLATMVFTHLPSNLLLIAVAFAPNLPVAITLLLCRVVLSQMDVPTRQAYVMALVDPSERTAAASITNTARYLVRPIGPLLAGTVQSIGLGAPFVIAGTIKSIYDLTLWRWFRTVPLPDETMP